MALVKGTDAYASVADADAALPYDARWAALADAEKEAYLRFATRLLDDHFVWSGFVRLEDQPLEWPRYSVLNRRGYVVDEDTVPQEIESATIEFARQLGLKDRTKDDVIETLGIVQAGGTNFSSLAASKVVPDAVFYLVPPSYYRQVRHRGRQSQGLWTAGVSRG